MKRKRRGRVEARRGSPHEEKVREMQKQYPSIEFVRQLFRYEEGKLFWLPRPREQFTRDRTWMAWHTKYCGKLAGALAIDAKTNRATWRVNIGGHVMLRHVIVWAIHKGEWRVGIDHENRNSLDDRIENLRAANQSQNGANQRIRRDSTSGFKGVCREKRSGKWRAYITVNGQQNHLGLFDDAAEAHKAYVAASQKYFGEFACGG